MMGSHWRLGSPSSRVVLEELHAEPIKDHLMVGRSITAIAPP